MVIAVAIVLGLCALAFVLYPLYRRSEQDLLPVLLGPDAPEIAAVSEQEQSARNALQEVELDYQLGNIAEPDYRNLRERYMRRALVALKSRRDRDQEIDAEIEAQLHAMKESHEEANK